MDNSFCSVQNHHKDNTGQGWNEVADTTAADQTCKQKKKDLHLLKINIYQDLEHQGFTTEEKLKKKKFNGDSPCLAPGVTLITKSSS